MADLALLLLTLLWGFSHWYGGEPLSPADSAGGALVVLGVVVGEVGSALPLRRRTA